VEASTRSRTRHRICVSYGLGWGARDGETVLEFKGLLRVNFDPLIGTQLSSGRQGLAGRGAHPDNQRCDPEIYFLFVHKPGQRRTGEKGGRVSENEAVY
jgi:hypothetical protein